MVDYATIAREARKKVLELIHKAQTSHIGSNFSCIDILTVLFEKIDLNKDVFVLSAGWKAASLYYFLWRKGRITEEQLNSYCQDGSEFIGLAEPIIPEIKIAGGSMGLGLPGAVGIALAKKIKNEDGKVYVLMSDGELNCGTTWESALIAAQHHLTNLIILIDGNGFQAMGKTEEVLTSRVPKDYTQIDGHNFDQIDFAISDNSTKEAPIFIWANTVKGKGVSFMENDNLWHYWHVDEEHYKAALKELNG